MTFCNKIQNALERCYWLSLVFSCLCKIEIKETNVDTKHYTILENISVENRLPLNTPTHFQSTAEMLPTPSTQSIAVWGAHIKHGENHQNFHKPSSKKIPNRENANFLINTGINLGSLTEIPVLFVPCQVALADSKVLWYFPSLVLPPSTSPPELPRGPF